MNRKSVIIPLFLLGAAAEASAASPYIAKVHDFMPAPGQFVNMTPEWEPGMTREAIIAGVEENIAGAATGDARPGMISLGSFGGYVVFSFDHPVVNVAGEADFRLYGNSYAAGDNTDGGSSEPGIVMVSVDTNGNGLPDDPWYELAGSDYSAASTRRDFSVTYYRPDATHSPTLDADRKYVTDATYIRWTASDGSEGYIPKISFHTQSYWPEWIDADRLTFTGTRLPSNAVIEAGNVFQPFFGWGYADNRPDTSDPGFNIDNAVDGAGNHVSLAAIDFIKVYTGQLQQCAHLGESSTELTGGEDLHPDAVAGASIAAIVSDTDGPLSAIAVGDGLYRVVAPTAATARIYTLAGMTAMTTDIAAGISTLDITVLPHGLYILSDGSHAVKLRR